MIGSFVVAIVDKGLIIFPSFFWPKENPLDLTLQTAGADRKKESFFSAPCC